MVQVAPLLLGIPEVCKYLSIQRDAVYSLIHLGKLNVVTLDGNGKNGKLNRTLVTRESVDAYVRSCLTS